MFRKKRVDNKFSTSRFVQSAGELDMLPLFSDVPLTVAISKTSVWDGLCIEKQDGAQAFGVLHSDFGGVRPQLPIEVEFFFSRSSGEGCGWGEVWNDKRGHDDGSYRARLIVFDPDAKFFSAVERAVAHAAMSRSNFVHLTFRRERKGPYDAKKRTAEWDALKQRMDTLAQQIDEGANDAELPNIKFDSIAVEDAIYTAAGDWSHMWSNDTLQRPLYHSEDYAAWRKRRWSEPDGS